MKTETWKMKDVAGAGAPWATVGAEAVKVTKSNLEDVAKWTRGKVSGPQVLVPVRSIVGDPNRRVPIDPKTDKRDIRAIQIEAKAAIDDYVVKWRDLFFVVSEEDLQQGWEKEK